jgi:predicted GH43/DUF377 family glycosyl hydrolase
MTLKRYEGNPILTARGFPRPVNSVFNAAATKYGDEYILLNRIEDLDGTSCFWVARSQDGIHFTPDPQPAMVRASEGHYATYEEHGIEDPRITKIADVYFVTYTCYSRYAPCVGLAQTRDFRVFERMGIIALPQNKDVVLFPEKIGRRYARLDRPSIVVGKCDVGGDIWISYSPDLLHWGAPRPVMRPREGRWDSKKIGAGAPPIKTEQGWLEIYHGVRETGSGVIYRLGAVLLDLEDPSRVVGRTAGHILSPAAIEDFLGDVMNVVFTCGAILEDDGELKVYYGAADQVMCLATAPVDEVIALCLRGAEEPELSGA